MCEGYQFRVNYFEGDEIKADLFSDEAERVVKCFFKKNVETDYEKKGNKYKCKNNQLKEDCPRNQRKVKKSISSTQIRKFYEEVLNLKAQYDNGKSFREILPYFRMLKAKANVAYERDVINTNFKRFIEENVDYVGSDEKRFKIFCTFFEAVVAYAKGTIKD
jgi:CRISPR-associated protein Csm2